MLIVTPLVFAAVAGILLGVFTALLGGEASFKQVFAVVSHAGVISIVQQLFVTPLNYARESLSSPANLSVFFPMLDEGGFLAGFLGSIDLFLVWQVVVLAIGLGILYRRPTRSILLGLGTVYSWWPSGLASSRPCWGSMTFSRKKVLIGLAVVAVAGAVAFANLRFRRAEGKLVNVEAVAVRDLEAIVSASGKINPKRSVNISADTMGRITELAVQEGQIVTRGQFLLQIDPRNLESAYQRSQAGLAAAESQLAQMRALVRTAEENLGLARENLRRQRDLWTEQLTTKEALDRAETEVRVRETELAERQQQLATQDQRIRQERAGSRARA